MTASQATAVLQPTASSRALSLAGQQQWARRRPAWTRTDTARHLDTLSEPLLALYRRLHTGPKPSHTRAFGYWLKDRAPALFDRAHLRLAAAPDDAARSRLLPSDLL